MMVWTFLPLHSLVVFQAGLTNLIRRIGPTNDGTKVSHKFFSCYGSHELQNCCHIHLPLPSPPLKIFCPLHIRIES
ncbi:hypothetical protein B0H14DRAFT_2800054 [Mycena olivaceomarginata]|nr:hypothetical protein B0H14DRAFT_2800054 [Mycena olivaceomarginata]